MAAFRKSIPELATKYDKSSLKNSLTSFESVESRLASCSDEENDFEKSEEDSCEELPDKQGLSKVTKKTERKKAESNMARRFHKLIG